MRKWQCRYAPSLGELEGTPKEVWGTKKYKNKEDPTVFFGLYGMNDFMALWNHKGRKCILWAGSDIRHFMKGYWLKDGGRIKISPEPLAKWIALNCESYVENIVEYKALKKLGIESTIVPSFMGNIDDYDIEYTYNERPQVYASVSGDDFKLYKWEIIDRLASIYEGIDFHLYGNTKKWESKNKNVIVHGRVPKEIMNEEIKKMQGGIRLLDFDGFSEIIAKSILWGQYPISAIPYPHTLSLSELNTLKDLKEPNFEGQEYYKKIINNYPWRHKRT